MNGKSIALTYLLLVACTSLLGCRTLGESKETDFLKPLETSNSPSARVSLGTDLSEREICAETAKTVAEKGHATEAIKLYEKAERLAPKEQPFDLELAPLYVHVGDTESAIARYRNAIGRGHADSDVFNNLAWTLMDSGRYDEAIETLQQRLTAEPENNRLQATHAVILFRRGDRESSFQKFVELYGESAAHHNLALLDLDAGNVESAVKHANLAKTFPGCSAESIKLCDAIQSRLATADSNHAVR